MKNRYIISDKIIKLVRQPSTSYIVFKQEGTTQLFYQPINETAVTIFEFINQNYTFNDIVNTLMLKYNDDADSISNKISTFIDEMQKYNIISISTEEGLKNNVPMIGSSEYFTPEYCVIELTSCCHLNCKHCYLGRKDNASMDIYILRKLLNDVIELGIPTVQLTGGEPLLYKEFDEVISFLVDNNIRTLITTGAYINDDKYKRLLTSLLKIGKTGGYVQVSIDGDKDIHNSIRGRSDSFKKVKRLILDLRKNNILVTTAMSVMESNIDEIEQVAKLVKSWGVSLHRISGLAEMGNALNLNKIDFLETQQTVRDISNKYSDKDFHITTDEENIRAIKYRITPNCGCGSLTLGVDSSFNVFPCVMIREPLFNLCDTDFKTGLKGIKNLYNNKEAPSEKTCGNCKKLSLCQGCIAQGLIEASSNKNCIWKSNKTN
jgi:MoaA/NifB/PqqE/SkfB family radical SAM enzyme